MKERLTGAIILVALIVVLVPELLRGPIRSTSQTPAVASPNGEPPLRSYTIDLADEHPHGAVSGSGAPLATGPLTAAAASPATAPPSAAAISTTPSATPAAAASVPAVSAAGTAATATTGTAGHDSFVVQLGSFANRANAERLARQVHAEGFAVSVSRASSGRRLYQVRAGPAGDRAKATQLAEQLRAHGHTGAIVPE